MPSSAIRLPVSLPSTMAPPPEILFVSWNARMLLLLRLIVPPSVSPLVMRSLPPLAVKSSLPLSVTPLRKPLNATSAPVPVVAIVPPVMVPPNWLATLPLAMLMVPPVLLMLWPPGMPMLAVAGPPTLMVPVLVVLPPPTKLSPNASMLMVPALDRVRIDWPVVMVTVLAAAMVALSPPPGTTAQDHSPATLQSPDSGFQVQLAAEAGRAAPKIAPPTKSCATN